MNSENVKKNVKNIIFIVILALIFSMVGQKVYAQEILQTENGLLKEKNYVNSNRLKNALTFNDLKDDAWLFCMERGIHIPSTRNTEVAYNSDNEHIKKYEDGETTDDQAEVGSMSKDNLFAYYNLTNQTVQASPNSGTYQIESAARYNKGNREICKPHEAFVLSETENNTGSYYSVVQQAWWCTDAGKEYAKKETTENPLFIIADKYEEFVKLIAYNVDNKDTYVRISNGQTSIYFPELKADDDLLHIEDKDVKVHFDEKRQKYIVGPYKLQYVKQKVNDINFGFISNMELHTNEGKVDVSKWKIICTGADERINNYPNPNEEFYVEMDYTENATSIEHLYVSYQYLVAGGEYTKLEGKYDLTKYTIQEDIDIRENEDKTTTIYYNYKLQESPTSPDSQKLTWVEKAARWYNTVTTDVGTTIRDKGYIEIKKEVRDENGKKLSADEVKEKFGDYQYFDFRVKVRQDGKTLYNDIVRVRGGSSVTKTIKWKGGSAPTYEVEELDSFDTKHWKFKEIKDNKGTLKSGRNNLVTVIAVNECIPHYGNVGIYKTVKKPETPQEIEAMQRDRTFQFTVTLERDLNGFKSQLSKEDTDTVNVIVPAGQLESSIVTTKTFKWYGEAPEYTVEECETEDSMIYPVHAITPKRGYLKDNGEPVKVYVKNTTDSKFSNLIIRKELLTGQSSDDIFYFKIEINDAANTEDGRMELLEGIKAGEKIEVGKIEWKKRDDGEYQAPTFKITEVDENGNPVDSSTIESIEVTQGNEITNRVTGENTISGSLTNNGSTNVTEVKFTNKLKQKSGKIKVTKKAETEAKVNPKDVDFHINIIVKGEFIYNNKQYTEEESLLIEKTIKGDSSFETDDIIWYGDAPTYIVKEVNNPEGWQLLDITYQTEGDQVSESDEHTLKNNATVEAVVENILPLNIKWDLRFNMGGMVWVEKDTGEKDTDPYYGNSANGVYDEGEELKENVKVNVWKVFYKGDKEAKRELATIYDEAGNELSISDLKTGADGRWNVPKIKVPGIQQDTNEEGYTRAAYDVEFIYDGQTYEPTEFLSYKIDGNKKEKNDGNNNDKANKYKGETKSEERNKYLWDSMALISDRGKVITEVSGKEAMDVNGNTTGSVTFTDGQQADIDYTSDNAGEGYPTRSELITTNEDGSVKEIFMAKARTSKGGLTFPFSVEGYDGSVLYDKEETIDKDGIHEIYKFTATYKYCQNINLGLKKRPAVDIGLTKKLENAKVVVKEKLYEYKYSGFYDLTEEKQGSLAQYICDGDGVEVNYQLGLYQSDYYYRAELYRNNEELYEKLTGFYQKIFNNNNKDYTDSEMDIYLTYNIAVANNSSKYNVKINSIDDYYDTSLQLITATEQKYLKTKTTGGNETDVNALETVAEPSYINGEGRNVIWNDVGSPIVGSDTDGDNNIYYQKMTASNLEILLTPGDKREIKVTFKVKKNDTTSENALNAIILGQKCNVAEIASYSTYFANPEDCKPYGCSGANCPHIAGKIDRDSAPGNVNIGLRNDKKYYEDDTFAAPKIEVFLLGEQRTINGLAWEDDSSGQDEDKTEKPGYNQTVGNGKKDTDEKGIEGLTTELVEKVMILNEDETSYTEYDYIWPTGIQLEQLKNNTIEEVSHFDSTIETQDNGIYNFNNVPAGDYVVRFTYGDKEIESADYSEAHYYNGQDYKSTKYKAELKDEVNEEYVKPSAYLNLEKHLNSSEIERHNSAADSEVRRLQVISNSREITYDNNKILAAAMSDEDLKKKNGYTDEEQGDVDGNRAELLKGKEDGKYYMYADTPKIDMNIESKDHTGSGVNNQNQTTYYNVNNVDFGLEERPATQLTLDKQIEEIILTTSDGNTIMDAKYTINYKVEDTGEITANVELDTANSYGVDNLQALNRDQATNHGFRYINVDSNILEGTTITVKYRFTVLNTGEVDRTGKLADIEYTDEGIEKLKDGLSELSTKLITYEKEGSSLKNNTTMGAYVGSIYYYGENGNQNDKVVTTTVRQLVDYIDNDVTFSGTLNASPNTSWSNITAEELKEKIKSSIVEEKEENGTATYTITDSRNIQYETNNRNNLTVSVDSYGIENTNNVNNKDFIIELVPTQALQGDQAVDGKDKAFMNLTVTRYLGTDSDDLRIDNIAEIIKYNNKVGRRDILTIAGNQSPKLALEKDLNKAGDEVSEGMVYERDTSATEVITLSPPTGTPWMTWRLQVIASITAGLAIVAGGIVFIKKKILK